VRRLAIALLALASLATAGAAGGCGEGASEPQVELVAASQVVGRFERETGRPLQPAATEDEAWEQLSYGLDPPQNLLDRYGIFSVYVAKRGHLDAVGSLLRDKATKKPLERDSRGVYWELDSNSRTWVAYKRYGGNIVLVWFSGSEVRSVDVRWERLNRVLTGIGG
jgi:hypothetical protein